MHERAAPKLRLAGASPAAWLKPAEAIPSPAPRPSRSTSRREKPSRRSAAALRMVSIARFPSVHKDELVHIEQQSAGICQPMSPGVVREGAALLWFRGAANGQEVGAVNQHPKTRFRVRV